MSPRLDNREIPIDELLALIEAEVPGCCAENAQWLRRLALNIEIASAAYLGERSPSNLADLYRAFMEALLVLRCFRGE